MSFGQKEQRVARAYTQLERDVSDQYSGLSNGFGGRLDITDPLAHLAADVARCLIESGFTMRDSAGKGAAGGVCVVATSRRDHVIVSWPTHEVLRLDRRRYRDDEAAREVMNYALGDTLLALGWDVREYGSHGANLVVGRQRAETQEAPSG